MTPEEYAVHKERVLWLSQHPLAAVEAGDDHIFGETGAGR